MMEIPGMEMDAILAVRGNNAEMDSNKPSKNAMMAIWTMEIVAIPIVLLKFAAMESSRYVSLIVYMYVFHLSLIFGLTPVPMYLYIYMNI